MSLPLALDFPPMEAKLVGELPVGSQWWYEPKWDGFRCLAFRDRREVALRSKSGQPMERYFPEIVDSLLAVDAERFVVDGELVVPVGDSLSFDDLLQRIHPAQSRVDRLAKEHPALLVLFDLLVDASGAARIAEPLTERFRALERLFAASVPATSRLCLSPHAEAPEDARRWLESLGSGLDGIIAKRRDLPYQSGERTGMHKWKRLRSADCVVGGFRYGTGNRLVGSLLLGLYDGEGLLHHVGFSSNIKAADRAALTRRLEARVREPGFTGRRPGGPSRWSTERSAEWQPLSPELVVEVQYDHFSGDRFRHGTRLLRWRPDKPPAQCTLAQVEQESAAALGLLDRGSRHEVAGR